MAITIGAPLEAVWPWLAQMCYGRAGWYTHAWIEGHPDPGRIHPQYQHVAEGDLVPDAPAARSPGRSPRRRSRGCWCMPPPGG